MRPLKLLHKTLKKELPFIHKLRMNTLMTAVQALFEGNKLSLTKLGRSLVSSAKTRSNIKRMDRLLGNEQLQTELPEFYHAMNQMIISPNSTAWIHIDWSCISSTTNIYVLRASLSMQGRAIVVYEEAHPKKNENNHETHVAFLNNLKKVLPINVKPIIVTDAGFRGPWFKHVLELNWDFIGRLRNINSIKLHDETSWCKSHLLYANATAVPDYVGHGILTHKNKVPCQFIRYKSKSKKRTKLNKNKKICRSGHSQKHARSHKEPWVLVTSLKATSSLAQKVVKIYSQRMQIEENFRDTKCSRYGFSLKESGTQSPGRMGVLLLIGAIANFIAWVAGIETQLTDKESDYQAQSSKFKSVLSVVTLGREALKKRIYMSMRRFLKIINIMKNIASSQPELAF